jgi:peptidoglycan/LPS O-acetylase OafA/YrhL
MHYRPSRQFVAALIALCVAFLLLTTAASLYDSGKSWQALVGIIAAGVLVISSRLEAERLYWRGRRPTPDSKSPPAP